MPQKTCPGDALICQNSQSVLARYGHPSEDVIRHIPDAITGVEIYLLKNHRYYFSF
jgi:hypothetical protein